MIGAPAAQARKMSSLRPALSRAFGSGTGRVWILNLCLVLSAVTLTAAVLRRMDPLQVLPGVPWPALAVMFAAGEIFVVHIQYKREAHSFSLREIVMVVGLFTVSPVQLVYAQLAGGAFALVGHRRQSLIKLVFNLGLFAVEAVLTSLFFNAGIDRANPLTPAGWLLTLGAVCAVSQLSTVFLALVISLAEGRMAFDRLRQMTGFALAGSVANSSIGLTLVMLAQRDVRAVMLLAPPIMVLIGAYRAYTSERVGKERVETLYRSTHDLERAPDLAAAAAAVLEHAADMFRADIAEVTVLPIDNDGAALRARFVSGRLEPLHTFPGALNDPLVAATIGSAGNLLISQRGEHPLRRVLHERGYNDMVATVLNGENGVFGTLMVANRLGDVSTFDSEDAQMLHALASHASLTLENRRLEQQLKHQAFHDTLTRLANRALLTNRIEHAIARRPGRESVAVLYLDLDDFKLINDGLGHTAGDQLLMAVAERLRACLRPFDTAARLGGDEFAVLVEDARTPADAMRVAERVREALRTPFQLERQEVSVRASIGVVWAGRGAHTAEDLLRNADIAMYRAKAKGAGGTELFERSMQVEVEERHGMKADLQRAMDQGGLLLHYQPVVHLSTGRITGVEALVRWQHLDRGLLGPGEFVPLAEETGLILAMDRMVLRESLRQLVAWRAELGHAAPQRVSVNVSSRALRDPDYPRSVLREVEDTGLEPSALVLEITETVLLDDFDTACSRLQSLRDAGVRIAIDDFGTGYSSLGYLRRLPVDIVKIDRTFVAGIESAGEERSLTLAIVRMLSMLDVEIVAEGIETPDQLAYVQAMGCDHGQGYGLSRPLASDRITELLRQGLQLPVGAA